MLGFGCKLATQQTKLLKGQHKGLAAARHQQLSDSQHAGIEGFPWTALALPFHCNGIAF